jgi:uncharacterized integral membrane protein
VGRLAGAVGILLLLVLAMAFATLNGGQRVTVRLGFATFYGVPLTLVAFTGLLLGMLIMLVAGIRSDLKVRRILRDRLVQEGRAEAQLHFVDRSQQDLFADGPSRREAPEPRS